MTASKRLERKHTIAIIVSIVIILLVIWNLIKINSPKTQHEFMAKEGILDLKGWNIEDGNIDLDGEWEFYPGVFLFPEQTRADKIKDYGNIRKFINVPATWGAYLNEDGSPEGGGSYRLTIKIAEKGTFAIKTRTIRLASRIYMNGEKVIQIGEPSLDRADFKQGSKYRIGSATSQNDEIELIIHVSSYAYRTGGILKSIEFGSFESIILENSKNRALDGFLISVCLILSLYFFITYLQRNKERYLLYFSLMNLVMAVYLGTLNEQILELIFNYDFSTRVRIQMIGMILMVDFCYFCYKILD